MYLLNRIFMLITLLFLTFIYSFCNNDVSPEQLSQQKCNTAPQQANISQSESAEFQVTFIATWNQDTHPTNFPNTPHFSPLNGATHTSDITIWKTGSMASSGIEVMAEIGSPSKLMSEIENFGMKAEHILRPGINPSPNIIDVSFTATPPRNQLTLVSMLAPSHDWFIGISNFNLIENGQWIDEEVIELRLYDAGTEDGDDFSMSGSSDTNPREVISRVVTSAEDTNFGNSGSKPGEPFVGRFLICRK